MNTTYTKTIGIVCLGGNATSAKTAVKNWRSTYSLPNIDFVFVENGTTEEQQAENKEVCLSEGIRRVVGPSQDDMHTPGDKANVRSMSRCLGAYEVHGEYLWFVDGDCDPDTKSIGYLEQILSPEIIVSGRIQFEQDDGSILGDHREPVFSKEQGDIIITHNPMMIAEANMAVARAMFYKVGGFNVANYAVNGYCAEGVHFYWKALCVFLAPLVLHDEIFVTHKYHEPSEEKKDAHLNRQPLLDEMRLIADREHCYKNPKIMHEYVRCCGGLLRK